MAGVTTALIVGSLISAASTAYAAKKRSDSAKDAAATQVAGAKDAQGYIDRGYDTAMAGFAPYTAAGHVALGSLMATGGYGGGGGRPAAPTAALEPSLRTPFSANVRGMDNPVRGKLMPTDVDTREVDRDDLRAERRAVRLGDAMADPASIAAQTQSSYVKMQAPDGEVQPVPSQYVQHYTQLGARIVG